MTMDKKYTVGQMADLCNISAKQLRYFDEKKIIIPAIRDAHNNYRYYAAKQIEEVLLVKEMRQLGIPLHRVSYLLHHRGLDVLHKEVTSWLDDAREEINRAMVKYDKTLELVFRLMEARVLLDTDKESERKAAKENAFSFIDVAPRKFVFTRYQSYCKAEKLFINRRAELYGIIEKYGLETVGTNMAIFHDDYYSQFEEEDEKCVADLEICMMIKNTKMNCPHCRETDGFRAAMAVHIGHYRHLKPVYQALEQWVKDQGRALTGASVEEYIVGATHTGAEENYVTRILLPLAGYDI